MKKYYVILLLVFLLAISSCKKENSNSLLGGWVLNVSLADTTKRCSVFLENAVKNKPYVVFKADGTLSGNAFPQYVKYQTGNHNSLILYAPDGKSTEFVYAINKNVLQISLSFMYFTTPGCGLDTYTKITTL